MTFNNNPRPPKFLPIETGNGASLTGSHYIGSYRTCPRLWFYEFAFNGHGLTSPVEPVNLSIGRAVHEGIAAHLSNQSPESAIKNLDLTRSPDSQTVRETALAMVLRYIQHYQHATDVAAVDEHGPIVERNYVLHLNDRHSYTCRVDSIRVDSGFHSVYEIKTTSPSFMAETESQFSYSTQITGEYAILSHAFPDTANGVVGDIINKKPGPKTPPFRRTLVSRTPAQLNDFYRDIQKTLDDIDTAVNEHKQTGKLDPFPCYGQSTNKCVRYNSPCQFFNLCQNPDRTAVYLRDLVPKKPAEATTESGPTINLYLSQPTEQKKETNHGATV